MDTSLWQPKSTPTCLASVRGKRRRVSDAEGKPGQRRAEAGEPLPGRSWQAASPGNVTGTLDDSTRRQHRANSCTHKQTRRNLSSGDTLPAVPRAAESAFTHSNVRPQGKKGIPKSTFCLRTTHTNPTELAHAPWGVLLYRDTPTCKLAAARGTCTDSRAPTQTSDPQLFWVQVLRT